jgi:hypothetical protein
MESSAGTPRRRQLKLLARPQVLASPQKKVILEKSACCGSAINHLAAPKKRIIQRKTPETDGSGRFCIIVSRLEAGETPST